MRARARLNAIARIWALLTVAAWTFLLALVVGVASNTISSAGAATEINLDQPPPQVEQRRDTPQTSVEKIEPKVMCPSCDTTLDHSDSAAAQRMRAWIQAAVDAGWTEAEIRDGLVEEYGGDESILATPRASGLGLLVWMVPAIVVLLMLLVGIGSLRSWRRARTRTADSSTPPPADT